jgi:hypothetical protein
MCFVLFDVYIIKRKITMSRLFINLPKASKQEQQKNDTCEVELVDQCCSGIGCDSSRSKLTPNPNKKKEADTLTLHFFFKQQQEHRYIIDI